MTLDTPSTRSSRQSIKFHSGFLPDGGSLPAQHFRRDRPRLVIDEVSGFRCRCHRCWIDAQPERTGSRPGQRTCLRSVGAIGLPLCLTSIAPVVHSPQVVHDVHLVSRNLTHSAAPAEHGIRCFLPALTLGAYLPSIHGVSDRHDGTRTVAVAPHAELRVAHTRFLERAGLDPVSWTLSARASIRLSSVALVCIRQTTPSITARLSTDVFSLYISPRWWQEAARDVVKWCCHKHLTPYTEAAPCRHSVRHVSWNFLGSAAAG